MLRALHGGKLGDVSFNLFREQRPGGEFTVAGDDATQSNSPRRGTAGRGVESQALERNGKENDVSVPGDLAPRLPNRIKAEIVVIDALSGDAVKLDTQRVGEEFIGALAVMKGIERDADRVIASNAFALHHMSAQRAPISLADKGYVKIVIVIREERRGGLAGGPPVMRLALTEVSDLELGMARCACHEVLQLRRPLHARNPDRGFLLGHQLE